MPRFDLIGCECEYCLHSVRYCIYFTHTLPHFSITYGEHKNEPVMVMAKVSYRYRYGYGMGMDMDMHTGMYDNGCIAYRYQYGYYSTGLYIQEVVL